MLIRRCWTLVALAVAGCATADPTGTDQNLSSGAVAPVEVSPDVVLPRAATSTELAELSVSVGPLDPPFDPAVADYVIHGVNRLTPIEVSATAREPGATLQVNGVPVVDGQPVRLTLGVGEALTITSVAPARHSGRPTCASRARGRPPSA